MPLDTDPHAVSGSYWRHTRAGANPRYRPTPPADNRWQRGSIVDALYLAESADTAWAEWYRYLAEDGISPVEQMPRDLWEWSIRVEVADLSTPARLDRVGLPQPTPGRLTFPAYQVVGEQLWREGWSGLLAPSAARPSLGQVLCLFRTALLIPGTLPIAAETFAVPPPPPLGMTT
ncbi:MAG: RES family NAD+ phosphorylase [Gaiellaceae bacterium]